MRRLSMQEINDRIESANGLQTLMAAKRRERPTDNKPREQAEKLLLIEIASRKWEKEMLKVGERKWKYIGK